MNYLETIKSAFFSHLKDFFPNSSTLNISWEINTDEQKQQFDDISTNAALILAKELQKNPRILAKEICKTFNHEYIEKIDIAGPGFINFTLTKNSMVYIAQELAYKKSLFFKPLTFTVKRYSLEFVSANPTGPLHLGHGRGGIIGDVLGNILRFIGHQVTKEYYINDAGTQINKLGFSFKIRCQQELGIDISLPEDAYHGEYLITLAKEYVKKHGPEILEYSDEVFAQYAKDKMLEAIKETLHDYGIHFDLWVSEKSLHEDSSIKKALEILAQHGTTYYDDNALWFRSTQYSDDKDRVLVKSNGELTYIAADVAYTQNKFQRVDRAILVLGQDHHSYVVRLKGITAALGYDPNNLEVILYQLITLNQEGQQLRMSKRAGTMVSLHEIIEIVGKDVARFFFLHRKADAHLNFDLALALKKTEENPVYYLQYAYVRTKSIIERAHEAGIASNTFFDMEFLDSDERLLIKKIISLKDLLITISQNYQTHLLTYYSLELAQLFHRYYANHRVLEVNHPNQSKHRLTLIHIIRDTIAFCLDLLGISKPEKM